MGDQPLALHELFKYTTNLRILTPSLESRFAVVSHLALTANSTQKYTLDNSTQATLQP